MVVTDSIDSLPIVLVPGLNCSARLYGEQIPTLWRFGPVMVADHTRDANIADLERQLSERFATRVELAQGRGSRGKLVIHYHSNDELEGILGKIR